MKKWLSLIVMTSLLLGTAYLAVATEAGREMLNRSAATRVMLAEIDAMLAKDSENSELLAKREEVIKDLAAVGEAMPPASGEKSAEYLRSIGAYEEAAAMELDQAEATNSYLETQFERIVAGLPVSEVDKLDLYRAGYFNDSRPADDRLDDVGGPDASGYRFVDNLNGDSATFEWIELCGDPLSTEVLTTDDNSNAISWGWSFPFYGGSYTSGFVNSNGQLNFVAGSSSLSNTDISATNVNPAISGFWDDLDPDGGGSPAGSGCGGVGDNEVRYRDFGDKVVISWTNTPHYSESTDRYNFQIIIFPNGKVKLQYNTNWVNGTTGAGSSSINIDGPQTGGVSYIFNGVPAGRLITNAGRAIWFYQNFLANDFSCNAVVQPSPLRVSPSQVFNVIGRFRNTGSTAQSSPVKYHFNGGPIVTEATAVLAQGLSEDHDFAGTETAPAAVGDYSLQMWSDLAIDEDRTNDTLRVTIQVRDCYDEAQTGAFVDAGTTCGALNEWANTCMGTADASEDYIYQWTVSQAGNYNLRYIVPTSATLGFALSSSCPPDSFNCIRSTNLFQDTVSFSCVPLNAGTYYITVDRSTGCGTYTLQVGVCVDLGRCCYNNGNDCADNASAVCAGLGGQWDSTKTCANNPCPLIVDGGETCAQAVQLNVPSTVTGSTAGAIDDDPGFQCTLGSTDPYEGSNTAGDEWYSIVGTGDTIIVSLCNPGTVYDTQILVVCSGDCQSFTCVAGNDDTFSGPYTCGLSSLRSTAWFCSEVGRTYYIVVDGWGTATGAFELSVTRGGACAGAVDCAPTGRCCYLNNGTPACVDNLAPECSALGGQWNDAASCANTPCPVGRCCYVDNGLGACETNTQLECTVLGGTWTSTTTCEATPCPVGRCCYDDNGSTACANDIIEACNALSGVWNGAETCESAACPTILQGSDLCVDAVLIPVFNQQYVGSNVGATAETGLPACASWYGTSALGVWYKLVGTGNTITIALCDPLTTYDSEIGVFCHPHCDSLVCVTSDDDFCTTPGLASQVSFCSVLGAEYKLLVTAFSTGTGTFAFTVSDDGVTCVPTVVCPTGPALPCDPVVDLAPYVVTVGNTNNNLQLRFTAPQDETYIVWSTTNPNNDGDPNSGADVDWTLDATLPNLLAGPQVWDAPLGFPVSFRVYVVTADCPAAP